MRAHMHAHANSVFIRYALTGLQMHIYRCPLYIRYQSWKLRSDLTNTVCSWPKKVWLCYVATAQKCSAGTETSSLQNHGMKSQEILARV